MTPLSHPASWNRRDFLRVGSGLAMGSYLTPKPVLASNPRSSAKSCILIYLLGGPPQLDTFDLKPNAPSEIRGPFNPIASKIPGFHICEYLPQLAKLTHRYSLIRSVSHNNHNHTPMIYYTLTGRPVDQPLVDNDVRPPQRTDFPHLGAILAHLCPVPIGLPGYVAIPEVAVRSSLSGEFKRTRSLLRGGGSGFLGPKVDPFPVNDDPGSINAIPAFRPPEEVTVERQESRMSLLSVLDHGGSRLPTRSFNELRRQAVVLTGASGPAIRAFSLKGEPDRLQDRYGKHRFGRALLLARRLAEVGVPMIAIHFNEMTICDGWDTHAKNFEALKSELLPMIDQGVSALLEDLNARGLLDQTQVTMMGEFGRTPKINKDAGRDHWGSCQSVLMAGGGIRGGTILGASDRIGAYPTSDPLDPVDIHATIYHAMGLDPEHLIYDPQGRPYPISTGRPIKALFG